MVWEDGYCSSQAAKTCLLGAAFSALRRKKKKGKNSKLQRQLGESG